MEKLYQYDSIEFEATTDRRIRVDINANDGRTDAHSLVFNNWNVPAANEVTAVFNDVTFTLSNGGTTGGRVKGANWKGLILSDGSTPRLAMDGAIIEDAVSGGTIKLEITGLSAGTHTLTTWHAFWDNVVGSTMTLSIDGVVTATGIKSVTRPRRDSDAGITHSEFQVLEGATVTVLVSPDGNGTFDNAVLNAFVIDGANPFTTISNPNPEEGEEHFIQEEGLSWEPGEGAISHDVYLGTDFDAVNMATTDSPEFMRNQTEPSYPLVNLSHMETYFWRVDEISDYGLTKGEVLFFQIAHLAFPSAQGYGRFAKGGRGGRVIEVTNLNDSGEGSFRQAIVEEKGPRIIVFRVGGVIQLESRLAIPNDGGNVYVAGQTAPGDGITLTHYAFGIYYSQDVIIRHVRLRVGDENGVAMDGIGMAGGNHCIVDHCSMSWTTDEGTSSRSARNITFQHNIIAEALNNSVHYDSDDPDSTERHSFAASISGRIGSFHHNLLTNCTGRNWSLAGGLEQDGITYAGYLDIRNNIVYNYYDRTTDGGAKRVNFVNNIYKKGYISRDMNIFSIDGNELGTYDMQMAYLSGNMLVTSTDEILLDSSEDSWLRATSKFNTIEEVRSDEPFFESHVETEPTEEAYESVLDNVGATVPKQDYLDQRYVEEVRTGTYTYIGSRDGLQGIIDTQEDVGGYPQLQGGEALIDSDHDGMPDEWEIAHGLDPNDPEDRNGFDLSAEGYTNLEMYLHELAGDELIWKPYSRREPSDDSSEE